MDIGARIRQARLAAGMSQARLAEQMGVTRSACSQWELPDAGTAPRRRRLEELARLLGVSYTWLAIGQNTEAGGDSGGADGPAGGLGGTADYAELIRLYERLSPEARKALLLLLKSLS